MNGSFQLQSTRSSTTNLFGFHDSSNALGMGANVSGSHRFTQRLSMNASYNFTRQRTLSTPYFANLARMWKAARSTARPSRPSAASTTQPGNYWGPPGLGFSTSLIAGLSDGTYSNNRSETNAVSASVNWNKFRHNVQIGGDFRRQENNVLSQANPRGYLALRDSPPRAPRSRPA